MKVAVVSHGRNEDVFFPMWKNYYGGLFGYENLYYVDDSSDNFPENKINAINIDSVSFPRDRWKFDDAVGELMTNKCNSLLSKYDVVIRTDVDEFVFPDTELGGWSDALSEVLKLGYVYSLGFDVIHRPKIEKGFDPSLNLFQQRALLRIYGGFCKPHAISVPVKWSQACHRVMECPSLGTKGPRFTTSSYLCMAHLDLFDVDVFTNRINTRGDLLRKSMNARIYNRNKILYKYPKINPYVSIDLFRGLRQGISDMMHSEPRYLPLVPESCAGYERNAPEAFLIEAPDHLELILEPKVCSSGG